MDDAFDLLGQAAVDAGTYRQRRRRRIPEWVPEERPELVPQGERWRWTPDGRWWVWNYLDERWDHETSAPPGLAAPASEDPVEWWRDPVTEEWHELGAPGAPRPAPPPPPPPPPAGETPAPATTAAPGGLAGEPVPPPPGLDPGRQPEPTVVLPPPSVSSGQPRRRSSATWPGVLAVAVGSTFAVLVVADALRWGAFLFRSLGPFLLGNDPYPDPPTYPPAFDAQTATALITCIALLTLIGFLVMRLTSSLDAVAARRRHQLRATSRRTRRSPGP